MRRYLNIFTSFFKFSFINLTVYRSDLFFNNLGFILEIGVLILFFKVLYFKVPEINGWRFEDFLLIMAASNLLEWVIYFFYEHNHRDLTKKVNRGELDTLLLKPIDIQFLVSFRNFNFQTIAGLIVGILLIFYAIQGRFNFLNLGYFILLFLIGTVIHYAISLMISTISFFSPKMEDFRALEGRLRDLTYYPMDVYPPLLKFVFKTIIPIAFFTTVPAQVFSNPSLRLFIEAFMVAGIFLFLSRKFFLTGLKRYASASS